MMPQSLPKGIAEECATYVTEKFKLWPFAMKLLMLSKVSLATGNDATIPYPKELQKNVLLTLQKSLSSGPLL